MTLTLTEAIRAACAEQARRDRIAAEDAEEDAALDAILVLVPTSSPRAIRLRLLAGGIHRGPDRPEAWRSAAERTDRPEALDAAVRAYRIATEVCDERGARALDRYDMDGHEEALYRSCAWQGLATRALARWLSGDMGTDRVVEVLEVAAADLREVRR